MSNVDRPHGLRPIAGPYRTRWYDVDASATAIGIGDIVILETDGKVARAGASPSQVIGVALSPSAASTAGSVLVSDHPDTIYEAQTDGSSGGGGTDLNAVTAMYANANIVDGTPVNGISIQEIDQDTGATTSTLPLKILRLHPVTDNAYGDYNRLECVLNTHILKSVGTAGLA